MSLIDQFESKVDPSEEPFLRELPSIISIVVRSFLQHLDIFVNLYRRQEKTLFQGVLDGSKLFNSIYSMMQLSKSSSSATINDEEFNTLISSLVSRIGQASTINRYITSLNPQTDIDKVFEVVKWLIVPIRLNTRTIPSNERELILKSWFSIVFTLPLNPEYITGYSNAYPIHSESANTLFRTVLSDSSQARSAISQIQSLGDEIINAALSSGRITNNTYRVIRGVTVMFIITSVDIIQKFCPNLSSCIAVCSEFDGRWIEPLDMVVNDQLQTISRYIQRLE